MGTGTVRGRVVVLGVGSSMVLALAGVVPAAASGFSARAGSAMAVAAGGAATKLSDPIPAPIRPGRVQVGLHIVATGLVSPVAGTVAPGVAGRLFVADQIGKIWSIDIGRHPGHKVLFADLTPLVVKLGDIIAGSRYDERGLLGLAFDPGYQHNGLVYTYLTEPWGRPADFSTQPGLRRNCDAWLPFEPRPCQNVVAQWRVHNPKDPNTTIDMSSMRELMRIDKPQFNHNAGALAFGPDGLL
jgi:hypothetical protein